MDEVVTAEMREQEIEDRGRFEKFCDEQDKAIQTAGERVRMTKEIVMQGTRFREEVEVDGYTYVLRPLRDVEFQRVARVMVEGLRRKDLQAGEVSLDQIIDKEQAGRYLAVALMLSCDGEEWTPEEVGTLPPGVPQKLYEAGGRISGFPKPPDEGGSK